MERLGKSSPTVKLTDAQRKELAELDSIYAAKIAEREISLKGMLGGALQKGDYEAAQSLEKQLGSEKKALQAQLEEKKERVRQGTK